MPKEANGRSGRSVGGGMTVLLSPAAGAVLMSLSTVIVAVNARGLKFSGSTG